MAKLKLMIKSLHQSKAFIRSIITSQSLSEAEQYYHSSTNVSPEDLSDLTVIPNFITEAQETTLLREIDKTWKRVKYEYSHWDDAIIGYRETEKQIWKEKDNSAIVERLGKEVISFYGNKSAEILPHVHILDLAADGYIKPHIDSVKFCGGALGGISLISTSVMKFVHSEDSSRYIVALLPRLSLYIMRNGVRYNYSHEILQDQESYFMNGKVNRQRRVSIICRTKP